MQKNYTFCTCSKFVHLPMKTETAWAIYHKTIFFFFLSLNFGQLRIEKMGNRWLMCNPSSKEAIDSYFRVGIHWAHDAQ
jgi:hypothetical protein